MTSKYLKTTEKRAAETNDPQQTSSLLVSPSVANEQELKTGLESQALQGTVSINESPVDAPLAQDSTEEISEKEVVPSIPLVPAALRNYQIFLKVDRRRYISDEDFNRLCVVVAGDQRRIFQRVIMGIYQRALSVKDSDEVKRARLLLSLHERGALYQSLGVV